MASVVGWHLPTGPVAGLLSTGVVDVAGVALPVEFPSPALAPLAKLPTGGHARIERYAPGDLDLQGVRAAQGGAEHRHEQGQQKSAAHASSIRRPKAGQKSGGRR